MLLIWNRLRRGASEFVDFLVNGLATVVEDKEEEAAAFAAASELLPYSLIVAV